MKKRARIIITGNVTNVGYRYWTKHYAVEMGLTGWVRNVSEGLVEAVFEGDKEKIEEMIGLCKKGPEASLVKKVAIEWQEANGEYHNFIIKR